MIEPWKKPIGRHVAQSLLAFVFVGLALFALRQAVEQMILVASLGSSAFVVFAMPHQRTARPRNLVGGQMACFVIGRLCAYVNTEQAAALFSVRPEVHAMIVTAATVGLCVFVMTVLDVEHAPAVGTAMGAVWHGWPWTTVVTVFVGAAILSLSHQLLRNRLKDLF